MAKGDKNKVEGQIQTQGNQTQTGLDQTRQNTLNPEHGDIWANYQNAANQGQQDYGNIMKGYQDFAGQNQQKANQASVTNANYTRSPEMNSAMGTFKEFSDTGGYTPQQIQELRARGVSPIRSTFASAMQNLNRQKALQGGYSPNMTAAIARMQGALGSQLAEQTTNVNAGIAENQNKNRLSGASGLGGLSQSDSELATRVALANAGAANQASMFNAGQANQTGQFNAGLGLEGLAGQRSLYGTSPAAAATFGNQVLDSSGQLLNAQGQQGQLGSNIVNQQTNAAQIPSNFDTTLGRIGRIAQIGGAAASPFMGGAGGFLGPGGGPQTTGGNPAMNLVGPQMNSTDAAYLRQNSPQLQNTGGFMNPGLMRAF